jgi:hypothetical protein
MYGPPGILPLLCQTVEGAGVQLAVAMEFADNKPEAVDRQKSIAVEGDLRDGTSGKGLQRRHFSGRLAE